MSQHSQHLFFSNFRKPNSNWKGKNMVEELRRVLSQHIAEIPGILALVISDKDGVPILQANTDNAHTVDACLRYQFLSSHAIVKESSKKVQLNGMKKSLVCYKDKQILSVMHGSLILSIIGKANANTGQMENLAKQMQPIVNDVSNAVLG